MKLSAGTYVPSSGGLQMCVRRVLPLLVGTFPRSSQYSSRSHSRPFLLFTSSLLSSPLPSSPPAKQRQDCSSAPLFFRILNLFSISPHFLSHPQNAHHQHPSPTDPHRTLHLHTVTTPIQPTHRTSQVLVVGCLWSALEVLLIAAGGSETLVRINMGSRPAGDCSSGLETSFS